MKDPTHPEEFTARQLEQALTYTQSRVAKDAQAVRAVAVPNIFKETDTGVLSYTIDLKVALELPGLLEQLPTKELYKVRDIVDRILGKRSDAKR